MNRTVNATIGLLPADAPSGASLSAIQVTLIAVALSEPVVLKIPAADIAMDSSGNALVVATFKEVPPGAFSVVAVSLDQDGNELPGFSVSGSGVVPEPNKLLKPSSVDIRLG